MPKNEKCQDCDPCSSLRDVFVTMPDGQRIRVIVAGNCKNKDKNGTIFFLHGLGISASIWYCYQTYLARKGYFTIAMDMRGFGLSQPYIRGTQLVNSSALTNIAPPFVCSLLQVPSQTCPPAVDFI